MLVPWYTPGRNADCQLCVPPGGIPPGRNEMNPGIFWFSVPSPYTTHDPRLGLAVRSEPVFIMTVATACSGTSVYIDRMIAISSMCSPSFGNTSLTSMPDRPCFVNLNGDCIATPPMPGIGCPSYLASEGFGSHVSTCDGAPCAKMWMTLLALPTRGGRRGAKGDKDPAAWASAGDIISGINAARLNAPNPMPDRCRNC